MPLKHIRLELARDHEFPSGSRERGYEFVAPLDDDGHLVAKEWQTVRERCRVKRFWANESAELGHLACVQTWRDLGLRLRSHALIRRRAGVQAR
jgi:hypothetical protein